MFDSQQSKEKFEKDLLAIVDLAFEVAERNHVGPISVLAFAQLHTWGRAAHALGICPDCMSPLESATEETEH
jgi:hypothetical protein